MTTIVKIAVIGKISIFDRRSIGIIFSTIVDLFDFRFHFLHRRIRYLSIIGARGSQRDVV
jgi:hypothetical protein